MVVQHWIMLVTIQIDDIRKEIFKMYLCELSNDELVEIEGGSIWKYIGAIGAIGFGAFEVYTGVGTADGAKNIATGALTIGVGIYSLIN